MSQFRLRPTHSSLHFPGSISQRGGTVTPIKLGDLEHLVEAAARVVLHRGKASREGKGRPIREQTQNSL